MFTAKQISELIYQASFDITKHARNVASATSAGITDPVSLVRLRSGAKALLWAIDEYEAAPMVAEAAQTFKQAAE